MPNNAMMTATPNEIITKLLEQEAAIKRQNELAPEALLFAKKGGKGGNDGNVGEVSTGSKSPKRDKRDNMDIRKENVPLKSFHCQWRRHITEYCMSKQFSDPAEAADTGPKSLTGTTSTLTTSIQNYRMVASPNV